MQLIAVVYLEDLQQALKNGFFESLFLNIIAERIMLFPALLLQIYEEARAYPLNVSLPIFRSHVSLYLRQSIASGFFMYSTYLYSSVI